MAAALLLLVAWPGAAQGEGEVLALRLVSMKASGKRADGDEPRSDPTVRAYLPVLKPLGYDYYRGATGLVAKAPTGTELRFRDRLPQGLNATANWKRISSEEISLVLRLDRPSTSGGKLERVLKARIATSDGQHFVVRVVDYFPDGDLVLLMTASVEAN